MSIDNQKFSIPTKKIPIPNRYLVILFQISTYFHIIFLVFLSSLLKIWTNIGIFRYDKIGLEFGLCGCHFIGIGFVWREM